jgi:hypothetical protein
LAGYPSQNYPIKFRLSGNNSLYPHLDRYFLGFGVDAGGGGVVDYGYDFRVGAFCKRPLHQIFSLFG